MPIQKKKVKKDKDKSEAKPAGANVKQEPEELKPLAEYIDDRLELIRQVFSCVKPKEINYLLPDFLEGKSNDIIKERCLDELLGISTKRLRSIINNTKCPTDTESDSENSDLEKIEEHISLDEISSDSDADGKRSGKRNKANAENAKPADERNGGDAKSEKEMTVLELLELQARARAIRSQLALEPVTKIEIDSEHEDEDARQADVDTDEETNRVTRKRASPKTVATGSVENGKQPKTENSTTEQQPRRVRLKRNFRVRQAGDDSDADEVSSNATDKLPTPAASESEPCAEPKQAETVEPVSETAASGEVQKESDELKEAEKVGDVAEPNPTPAPDDVEKSSEVVAIADTSATKEVTSSPTPVPTTSPVPAAADSASVAIVVEESVAVEESSKQATTRDADRESSPEVIPVEASPETLCISSDSEEERLAKQRASIFVDNIEELDRQAQETVTEPPEKPADEDEEPEEGEISEEEEPPAPTVEESVPQENAPPIQSSKEGDGAVENPSDELIAADDKNDGDDSATSGNPETQPAPEKSPSAVAEVQLLSSGSDESGSESSRGSGSGSSGSSDSEADENEEKQKKTAEQTQKLDPAHDDADIVEIHDSGDEKLLLDDKPSEPENPEEKSWNSRWLKSNRVAKVMAASRLGNKVREKLKKKKQIQQAEQQQQQQQQQPQPDTEGTDSTKQHTATENQPAVTAVAEQPPNFEFGSVEHYRELVAQKESKD